MLGAVAAAVIGAQPLARGAPPEVAARAAEVLRHRCAGCHGGSAFGARANRGGFDRILDAAALIDRELVVPGDADGSELYQRLRDGEMPPRGQPRPTGAEREAVRAWIAAGAPPWTDRAPGLDADAVAALAAADLRTLPPKQRLRTRYVSLAHRAVAGADPDALAATRQAVGKLLASLSWRRQLARPVAVGAGALLLRVDLHSLGWSTRRWDQLARDAPGLAVADQPSARVVRTLARTLTPIVPADWLVHEASTPARYAELLELPDDVNGLEALLDARDVAGVVRAGFNGSGVSRHNRMIERRPLARGGYYWRSFDFRGSSGARSIFAHPDGPGGGGFEPDGGEIIFSLPNGMQAYMLVNGAGRRIDSAPTDIVTDPRRGDAAVANGVSCMGCHADGVIAHRDELRAHVLANARAFDRRDPSITGRVVALHPPARELAAVFAGDAARFDAVLAHLGVDPAAREPIELVARDYEAELDLARAASELGVSPRRLSQALGGALGRELGALRTPGGTVKRETWDPRVPELVLQLGLGRPLRQVAPDELIPIACDGGSAIDCEKLGHLLLAAPPSRRDRQAVTRAFVRACAGGRQGSCLTLGDLRYHAIGTARDLGGALALYEQTCRHGLARGCSSAAYLYEHGLGTRLDRVTADERLARACGLGRARSCTAAGDAAFRGSGVARDRGLAARLYQQGCDQGSADACHRLAVQLRWGRGVPPDWIRSESLFRRSCALGNQRACLYL